MEFLFWTKKYDHNKFKGFSEQVFGRSRIRAALSFTLEDVKKNRPVSCPPTGGNITFYLTCIVSQVLEHSHAEWHLHTLFCIIFLPHMAHI